LLDVVWSKAFAQALSKAGLDVFPEECTWTKEQIMKSDFFPYDDESAPPQPSGKKFNLGLYLQTS